MPEQSPRSAISDYRNSVQIFGLLGEAIFEPSHRPLLRRILSVDVPEVAPYFCMKEVGDPGNAQGSAQELWRSLHDDERAHFTQEFERQFLC